MLLVLALILLNFAHENNKTFFGQLDYDVTGVEDWTYAKLAEHYRSKMQKSLQKVASLVSEFDEAHRHKAQEILDNWQS
ncbi:2222_t:CDS:2 [Paraglomus occultum]|uniref:2222_t:CDS:1 n=1 Tax=Paraglomus occultum TaxID=144539 RepID=A0A9N8W7P8_9GLOM|nr:2222_t:CDS:2 [Paraglomus occultum]